MPDPPDGANPAAASPPLHPLALVAASRAGARLAARLGRAWPMAERHAMRRYLVEAGPDARELPIPLTAAVPELFARCRGLVIFLPLGAVVRLIAPALRSKFVDPAVVAVDDGGRFAICALSGHAGGGNRLAEAVAAVLGAQPVVTTAVERRGLAAPELLGRQFGWRLEASREALLRASAAIVNGRPIGLYCDSGVPRLLPPEAAVRHVRSLAQLARSGLEAVIVVSDRRLPAAVSERCVVWRPRRLVAGLGASNGAPAVEIDALLRTALDAADLSPSGLGLLVTLERKLTEPGLRELADRLGLELRGYPASELAAVAVPNPSEVVRQAVGTPSVAEAAALLASGGGELLTPKRASRHATVAIARRKLEEPRAISRPTESELTTLARGTPAHHSKRESRPGRLFIVGLGPGPPELLTEQARASLEAAEVIVGYRGYIEQAGPLLAGKELQPGELGGEVERAELAVELATAGKSVALVSSGDSGVYGMASPAMEAIERRRAAGQPWPEVEVVPGVSAALAAAALLGAPLGADFAAISLSDLLTPWEVIERRVALAAEADFVLVLYNPASRRRSWQFARARQLILQHRRPVTPVGLVRQAYRPDQEIAVMDLAGVANCSLDMMTIVLIGNSATRAFGAWLVTPRGYRS